MELVASNRANGRHHELPEVGYGIVPSNTDRNLGRLPLPTPEWLAPESSRPRKITGPYKARFALRVALAHASKRQTSNGE